jgi:hypothetical protein
MTSSCLVIVVKSCIKGVAHGRIEEEQEAIRQHALELLQGKRVLPMFVTNLPSPQAQQE